MTSFPPSFHAPAEPTKWPKTLGTIAIVFGILGVLGGFCGVIGSLAGDFFQKLAPGGAEGMPPPVDPKMMMLTVAVQAIGMGVAVMLLIGGLRLTKRMKKGVGLLGAWAITKILLVVLGSILAFFTIKQQFSAMPATKGAPTFSPETVEWIAIGGAVLGFLWGIALPVFIIIWFSRRVIRDEVESWS